MASERIRMAEQTVLNGLPVRLNGRESGGYWMNEWGRFMLLHAKSPCVFGM